MILDESRGVPRPTAHKAPPRVVAPGGQAFPVRWKGILTAAYNLAAPGLAPRFVRLFLTCSA